MMASQTAQARTHGARPPVPWLSDVNAPTDPASASRRPTPLNDPAPSSARSPLSRQRSSTRGHSEPDSVPATPIEKPNTARGAPSAGFLSPSVAVSSQRPSNLRRPQSSLGGDLSREVSHTNSAVPAPALSSATQLRDRHIEQWRHMQATLNEVDLATASTPADQQTGGLRESFNRIFPPAHARALEDLRRAQIDLARAWARSDAEDEAIEEIDEQEMGRRADGTRARTFLEAESRMLDASKATEPTQAGSAADKRPGLGSKGSDKEDKKRREGNADKGPRSMLEEETERDIDLARRRRQANDLYFERVNKGVVDVVAKLEDVANRMRAVEVESKEIWGEEPDDSPSRERRQSSSARSA